MKQEVLARLRIFSTQLLPPEITARVGLAPDASIAKGEYHGGKTLAAKRTEWQLSSGLDGSEPLERHVTSLLDRVKVHSEEIRALASASDCEITFSCVVYATRPPALYFESGCMASIANLGAALDIDLYLSELDGASE